jgi:hypothetical protein
MLRTVRDFFNFALNLVPVSENVTETTEIMRSTSRVEMAADGTCAWHCHSPVYIYRRAKSFFDHNFIIPPISTIKDAGTILKGAPRFIEHVFYMSCVDLDI